MSAKSIRERLEILLPGYEITSTDDESRFYAFFPGRGSLTFCVLGRWWAIGQVGHPDWMRPERKSFSGRGWLERMVLAAEAEMDEIWKEGA